MELLIKKSSRNRGKFVQKVPRGTHCNEVKAIASHDITMEAGKRKGFNYVSIEAKVLEFAQYDFIYIQIP